MVGVRVGTRSVPYADEVDGEAEAEAEQATPGGGDGEADAGAVEYESEAERAASEQRMATAQEVLRVDCNAEAEAATTTEDSVALTDPMDVFIAALQRKAACVRRQLGVLGSFKVRVISLARRSSCALSNNVFSLGDEPADVCRYVISGLTRFAIDGLRDQLEAATAGKAEAGGGDGGFAVV